MRSTWCAVIVLILSGVGVAQPVYRDRVEPRWLPGGTRFWYRNDLRGNGREFILVDAERGTRERAFDHGRVAAALGKAAGKGFDAERLPIEDMAFDAGGVVLSLRGGAAWRVDLRTDAVTRAEAATRPVAALASNDRLRASGRTGPETRITLLNRTAGAVDVHWLDPEGQRRRYATVPPGGEWEQHTFAGHVWAATDKAGKVLGVYEATEAAGTAVIGGSAPVATATATVPKPATRPRGAGRRGAESPDGRHVAVLREQNLYLRVKGTGEEFALTRDGKPDDAYALGDLWWSPDSAKLVALRTVPAQQHPVHIVESSPKDQLQPKLRTLNYLKPGDRVARPRPVLFDVAGRRAIPVREDLFANPWSVGDIRWAADSSRFTFLYNQRGHQVLRLVGVDAATGAATPVIEEASGTFVCYSGKFYCEWVGGGDSEILWMSERDGWNHLWLYDAKAGRVTNQVTKGEWVVQGVTHVDRERRQVWFRAGGVRPGQDPYYAHFCRVNFDGSGLVVLTEGDGSHKVQWSPGDRWLIDTWSRVDRPPVTELRRADDGRMVCRLEEADAADVLSARGGRWPEPFVAKGRDGRTDIYGVILRPRDFDPAKRYPVLENIYAGPQGFFAPKAFRANYGQMQRFADMGMIVVQCDGMGTSGRSKAFHDVCWRNLRDGGLPDRVAWIRAAAAKHPQMDVMRVGIYGGSAGGQNAMAALLWHNDFYKVAVADCGCHDNRMDKVWWNEQWMGWPVGPEYAANSNAVNAHLLGGKLMLVVGELDENVDPASTMQVAGALQKADKDFEMVVVVGAGHGAAETPYGQRRRAAFFSRHLLGREEGP